MRSDQHMGLTPDAIAFLEGHEIPEKCCKECKRPFPRELEVIGHYHGMGGEYPLHRHELADGDYVDEYIQAEPWSSGPCFFLGLQLVDSVFEWDQEDIDNV